MGVVGVVFSLGNTRVIYIPHLLSLSSYLFVIAFYILYCFSVKIDSGVPHFPIVFLPSTKILF